MDKRSFNILFATLAISMAVYGTYKITKKKNPVRIALSAAPAKTIK